MAHHEPPPQDLRCLQIRLFSSRVLKELTFCRRQKKKKKKRKNNDNNNNPPPQKKKRGDLTEQILNRRVFKSLGLRFLQVLRHIKQMVFCMFFTPFYLGASVVMSVKRCPTDLAVPDSRPTGAGTYSTVNGIPLPGAIHYHLPSMVHIQRCPPSILM